MILRLVGGIASTIGSSILVRFLSGLAAGTSLSRSKNASVATAPQHVSNQLFVSQPPPTHLETARWPVHGLTACSDPISPTECRRATRSRRRLTIRLPLEEMKSSSSPIRTQIAIRPSNRCGCGN